MASGTDDLKQALKNTQAPGNLPEAEWVGLREVRERSSYRHVRDGKPETNFVQESRGVMVEVLARGQFGYAATSRTDPESLSQAARQAYEQALRASKWPIHRFTASQRPKVTETYSSPIARTRTSLSAGDINSLLVRICEALKRPKVIRTEAFFQLSEMETRFISSNGSDAAQSFSYITSDFEATAQEGNVVQKRTSAGMRGLSFQGGLEFFETPDLWDRVRKTADQAVELLGSEECPTGAMSLILLPDQMMLQIHESIGHPLELDRILGDERNYAGSSFVKREDFGKLRYGSKLMNVTFDPTVPNEFASYAFDDNGVPASREHLIRDGVLIRALGGIESQARAGIPGVSNARAESWNRPPIDRMANINLEPGDASLEEMIASVERGVIMEANRSWSIDDFRNKFQFGCEYGKLVENGKITRTVRNPNYRGVTVPFWNGLKKVGDRSTFGIYGTPNCGKGEPNQVIRVGHGSPACLFEGVEVFGGAT